MLQRLFNIIKRSRLLANKDREETGTGENVKTLLQEVEGNRGHPLLPGFLRWKYPTEPILERCGHTYPIAVYPARGWQIQVPNSVLWNLQTENEDDKLLANSTYRLLRQKTDSKLEDRPTFTMKELIVDQDSLGMTCGLGSYFQALDTCDALEWEILSQIPALKDSSEESFKQFDRRLTLRSGLHETLRISQIGPVRHGNCRSAAIAISTLIAYPDEGSPTLWVKRRSFETLAVHGNLLHVIPSFMFQPATDSWDKEFSVTHDIFREYLEEIFNVEEPPQEGEQDWRYFYSDHRLQYLRHLLNTKRAELYLTGVAVNLLNLRPEICTLLLIRSSEWYRHHRQGGSEDQFHLNFEWETKQHAQDNRHPVVAPVPYQESDEDLMRSDLLSPSNMVPPGAAAFWLGIDLLRKVLNKPLPNGSSRYSPCTVFQNPSLVR